MKIHAWPSSPKWERVRRSTDEDLWIKIMFLITQRLLNFNNSTQESFFEEPAHDPLEPISEIFFVSTLLDIENKNARQKRPEIN